MTTVILVQTASGPDTHGRLKSGHVTITAKTTEFQQFKRIVFPYPREFEDLCGDDRLHPHQYYLAVYGNGIGLEDSGYLSLRFLSRNTKLFTGTWIVSIVDVHGNQRFSKSYSPLSFAYESRDVARIEKHVALRRLLSDPLELLPHDTLTVQIDIYAVLEDEFHVGVYKTIDSSLSSAQTDDVFLLDVDSPFAERLLQESQYFQRMLDTSMSEAGSRHMKLRSEEYKIFRNVAEMLMGAKCLTYNSVMEIFDMYIIGDKYDIPVVADTCTHFLRLCLSDHSAEELLRFADDCEFAKHVDGYLQDWKESVQNGSSRFDEIFELAVNDEIVADMKLGFDIEDFKECVRQAKTSDVVEFFEANKLRMRDEKKLYALEEHIKNLEAQEAEASEGGALLKRRVGNCEWTYKRMGSGEVYFLYFEREAMDEDIAEFHFYQ